MKHRPHLYLPGPWRDGAAIDVSDTQRGHLERVLRMSPGSEVSYTDGTGVIGVGAWTGSAVTRGEEESVGRPMSLVVAVAPPTSKDRLRFIVEKLGELGVEELRWIASRNGAGRLPKAEKAQAWAESALEQSRGAWLMKMFDGLAGWDELEGPVAACVPGEPLPDRSGGVRTVVVGPEGGFDDSEIPADVVRVGLGGTILRVETAAVVAATLCG